MLNRRKPSRDGHPAASGRAAAHAALPAHANDAPRSDKHTSNTRIPKSLYNKPTAATAARARNYLTLNALQNGPYCATKRVVSHCKTGRFTLPNGTYRCPGRYRRPDSHTTAKAKCGPPGHTTGCPWQRPEANSYVHRHLLRGLLHVSSIFSACSASASGAMPRNLSVAFSPPPRGMGV